MSWFQALDTSTYYDMEALEIDFIGAFTKTGIKHRVSSLITKFKQEEKESVRDCANRLKQYIARCPERELPTAAEKSVSIFLEGLRDKKLHVDLYAKKHKTLKECINDAIDLDDNYDIYGKDKPISGTESQGTASSSGDIGKNKTNKIEAMVELIMKRMNQVFKPPPRPIRCEVCEGDHPTSQCLPRQNPQPYKAPRTDKWCDFENKWTNHEIVECYHRIRYLREQGMAQQPPQFHPQGQGYAP